MLSVEPLAQMAGGFFFSERQNPGKLADKLDGQLRSAP
jgi:hypothetical protein